MRTQALGGICVLGLVGGFLNLPPASAATETVIHSFGADGDGFSPIDGVTAGAGGALFGATRLGGKCGCGTAFQLSPPAAGGSQWTESVLHSFQQVASDGSEPTAGLLAGPGGVFYGPTVGTNQNSAIKFGTIFQLTPPAPGSKQWTVKSVYRFKGGSDGWVPVGRLIADAAGALYGTTAYGGTGTDAECGGGGCGAVYKLTPPASGKGAWTEHVLYRFAGGSDGRDRKSTRLNSSHG